MTFARHCTALLMALVLGLSQVAPAHAQSLPIIRDTETENLLRDYARPIFKAAGVNANSVDIVIVNSKEFNAFVVSGRLMFINAGVLMDAETPNEVIGIIAHETGHIAGGHNVRLRQQMESAQILSVVGMLLGGAAMVGGAAAGNRSTSQAGQAVNALGNQVALRALLSYRRSEEDAADQSALKYLQATGQSAQGMIATFEKFASQQMFNDRYSDPYASTHPEARARLANISQKAQQSPYFNAKDDPALLARHQLMQAKLMGYLEHPRTVAQKYKGDSLPALYARATAAVRSSSVESAVKILDDLIRKQPNNPYFWEMRGEALLKARRAAEAAASYEKALASAPDASLIRVGYADALLAQGNVNGAISNYERGLERERTNSHGFMQLARAYAQAGREGEASLATAKARLVEGNLREAKNFAKRAQVKLPRGSAAWIQAEDILQIRG